MAKQRWQNESRGNGGYVLRQSDLGVSPTVGPGRWRNRSPQLSGRLRFQYRLLRIPLTLQCCGALLFATLHVVAWLRPIPRPTLITVSSGTRRMLLPTNTFAARDARALRDMTQIFDIRHADPDSLNHDEMRALIERIGKVKAKRSLFAWRKSTDFVYVNAPGIAIYDGSQGQMVPYLLPNDFVVHWNGQSAVREHAIPVSLLLDNLLKSKSDHKVLVLDCQHVDHLWAEGVLANQFVESVTALLQRSTERYGGLFVICSCSPGEVAWSDPCTGHSAFAHELLEGLAGNADTRAGDQDGRITLDELIAYVSRETAHWTFHHRNDRQHPCLVAGFGSPHDVVLAFVGNHRPTEESKLIAPVLDDPRSARLLSELDAGWQRYYEFGQSHPLPFHYSPHGWRHLEEALLRAEGCFRDGDLDEMEDELRSIPLRVSSIEEARHVPLLCRELFSLPMMDCMTAIGRTQSADETNSRGSPKEERSAIPAQPTASAPPAVAAPTAGAPSTASTATAPSASAPAASPAEAAATVAKLDVPKLLNRILDNNEPIDVLGRELLNRRATDPPLPVEAELLRSIVEQWPQALEHADRETLQARARELIRVRVLAERAALPARFFAPATFRWVKPWVDKADRYRRLREDDFFAQGGRPIAIEQASRVYATEDETLYERARNEATKIARALRIHERVLCDVPHCVRVAALRRNDGDTSPFRDAFEQHTRSLLADVTLLARNLQGELPDWTLEERSLKIAEIDDLAARLEATRTGLLRLVNEEACQLAQIGASGSNGSEIVWRRIDAILKLPFAYSHEASATLAERRLVLLTHLPCCVHRDESAAERNAEEYDQTSPLDAREIERRRTVRSESARWLALALYGLPLDAHPQKEEGELETIGYSNRVARTCAQAYLTAVNAIADPQDANRLFRADAACRIFEATLLDRGFTCDEQTPSRQLWRARIADLCVWHGQRFAEDFLAGPTVAAEPYFLKSARTYLDLARSLDPQSNSQAIDLENRLSELKALAERLRNPSGTGILFAQPSHPRFRGTTQQIVRFALEAPVSCPNGIARLRCGSAGEQLSVRSLSADADQFPFPYQVTRTEAPGFSTALHAELYFRGHVCNRQIGVEGIEDENGPAVVYRDERPYRAELSVQLSEADRRPANVLFVIDCSRSMADGDRMNLLVSSLRRFAEKAAGGEWNLGIRVFGDRIVWKKGDRAAEAAARMDTRVLLPVRPFSGEQFQDALADLQPTGESPLFQALLQARQDFPASARGEKVIIVVSDGEDNWARIGGKPGPDELEQAYQGSGIRIHAIGFQTDAAGFSQLQKIAAATGGACVQADAAEDLLGSLLEMMRIVNFSVCEQRDPAPEQEVHQGSVSFTGELIAVQPGRYAVRVTDQHGQMIAERSGIQLGPGQRHELTLQGGRLVYPRLDLSTDLAVARDADTHTLLRILRGVIRTNALEIDLALVNEERPDWVPRRIEIRVRPRNSEQWYVFRNLPTNIPGYHFPVWHLRLEKWPRAAANAEVEVAWSETEDVTPPRIVRWEQLPGESDMPPGLTMTRQDFRAVSIDGKLRDAAELTIVFGEEDASLSQWNFSFPFPVAYARQIYNVTSGVYTGRFVFRDGNSPPVLEIHSPQNEDNQTRLKTSFNLRLREVKRDSGRPATGG